MMSVLMLIALLWFGGRVLWWIATRLVVLTIGFRIGWKLVGRR